MDKPNLYICAECDIQRADQKKNEPKPTREYSVCFYMVDGSMFEATVLSQTEDISDFVAKITSKDYISVREGNKEVCCVNLRNVTRFMARKKEKEDGKAD